MTVSEKEQGSWRCLLALHHHLKIKLQSLQPKLIEHQSNVPPLSSHLAQERCHCKFTAPLSCQPGTPPADSSQGWGYLFNMADPSRSEHPALCRGAGKAGQDGAPLNLSSSASATSPALLLHIPCSAVLHSARAAGGKQWFSINTHKLSCHSSEGFCCFFPFSFLSMCFPYFKARTIFEANLG